MNDNRPEVWVSPPDIDEMYKLTSKGKPMPTDYVFWKNYAALYKKADVLVGILADLFEWSDRSDSHAILHVENVVCDMRVKIIMQAKEIIRLQDTIYRMNQSYKEGIHKASAEISQQCDEEISRRSNRLDRVKKRIENMLLHDPADAVAILNELYHVTEGTS